MKRTPALLSLAITTLVSGVVISGWLGTVNQRSAMDPTERSVITSAERLERVTSVAGRPVEAAVTPEGQPSKAISGRVVVRISDPVTVAALGARLEPIGVPAFYRLSVSGNVNQATREAAAIPGVESASPDYLVSKAATPNDPLYSSNQWGLQKISAPTAWDRSTGVSSTIVASLDTGINHSHQDFADKIWIKPGEIASNGIDDDGNGYIDDYRGIDLVNGTTVGAVYQNSPQGAVDDEGHGSLTASVIASATNNAIGIAGVNWQAKIMPVKVLDTQGFGSLSDVAKGITYAANNGAKVINMSLGAFGLSTDSATDAAIAQAVSQGVAVVAASGNDSSTSTISYPAINPQAIAVGASDSNDNRASFSNAGPSLSIVAPGSAIAGINAVMSPPSNPTLSVTGTDGTLAAGAYRYLVTAYNAQGETIPSDPINPVTITAGQKINAAWPSVFGATGYRVYRTAVNGATGSEKRLVDVGNVTTYLDAGATTLSAIAPPLVNKGTFNSGYSTASGTSLAAPHVAGVAALLVGLRPDLTPTRVKEIMQESATKVAGMNGQPRTDLYGYGRLNAQAALAALPAFSAAYVTQSAVPTMRPGETATISIDYRNTGPTAWQNSGANPVRLGTSYPLNRTSDLAHSSWLSPNRPGTFAGKVEAGVVTASNSILPGEVARFQFTIAAPAPPQVRTYREYFRPVVEGMYWLEDYGAYFDVTVLSNAAYSTQYVGQSASPSLASGDQQTISIDFRNSGTGTWSTTGPSPVRLGTSRTRDRNSPFSGGSWLSSSRPASFVGKVEGGTVTSTTTLVPGEVGRFQFTVTAPPVATTQTYREYVELVAEGVTWLEDYGAYFEMTVTPKSYTYSVTSVVAPQQLSPGASGPATVDVTNTGTATWRRDTLFPMRLGTGSPLDRFSPLAGTGWLSASRFGTFAGVVSAGSLVASETVAPGQIARFSAGLSAPQTGGFYPEPLQLVVENYAWLPDQGIRLNVMVPSASLPNYSYQYVGQSPAVTVARNTASTAKVQVRNVGQATWSSNGSTPVRLGTDAPRDRLSGFFSSGSWLTASRIGLTRNLTDPAKTTGGNTTIAPGEVAEFEFVLNTNVPAGLYHEYVTPVAEGVTWLSAPYIYLPIRIL